MTEQTQNCRHCDAVIVACSCDQKPHWVDEHGSRGCQGKRTQHEPTADVQLCEACRTYGPAHMMESRVIEGVPAVMCIHPAACIRRAKQAGDWCRYDREVSHV